MLIPANYLFLIPLLLAIWFTCLLLGEYQKPTKLYLRLSALSGFAGLIYLAAHNFFMVDYGEGTWPEIPVSPVLVLIAVQLILPFLLLKSINLQLFEKVDKLAKILLALTIIIFSFLVFKEYREYSLQREKSRAFNHATSSSISEQVMLDIIFNKPIA